MPKNTSLDQYKIPAFQRKRSLSAKVRKGHKPVTALEKRIAGIPVVKPKRVVARRAVSRRAVVSRRSIFDSEPISYSRESRASESFSSPLVGGDSGYDRPTYETPSYESPGYESPSRYSGESSYSEETPFRREEPVSESLPDFRQMRLCGKCEGYLEKIEVAIVMLSSSIRTGDRLVFESEDGGLFEQKLDSMQINREDVSTAYSGDDVGMKVMAVPAKGGRVYKVIE